MAKNYSQTELDAMYAAGEERRRTTPTAVSVAFDATTRTFTVRLLAGGVVQFGAHQLRELNGATDAQLAEVELSPSGGAISWPQIDMDISTMGLVLHLVAGEGWRTTMRAILMREAQATKSPAKAAAARENGKKGGRPRKKPDAVAERANQTSARAKQ